MAIEHVVEVIISSLFFLGSIAVLYIKLREGQVRTDGKVEVVRKDIDLVKRDVLHLKNNGLSALVKAFDKCQDYRTRKYDEFERKFEEHSTELARLVEAQKKD